MNIAICDDEPYMLDELSDRLAAYADARRLPLQVSRYPSGRALLERGTDFDALFLDIQMDAPDGLETARRLRERGFSGPLVFTTVLREPVFDAFALQAFDYLVKPLGGDRFEKTMDRVAEAVEERARKCLVVQKGGALEVVPFAEIVWCEVIGRKVYLHRQGAEALGYYEKMQQLAGQLDSRFFRCHRSYLINLDRVLGCRNGLVSLSDGSRVPVSRLRERELAQALLLRMKGGQHGLV